ncbi:MAG: hypothetical protein J6B77_00655, partial [Clostridia bacterium]|nr:hypothetical protein [Clostridia bacterium]
LAREGLGFCEFLLPHIGKVPDFRLLFSLPQRGKVPAQQADEVSSKMIGHRAHSDRYHYTAKF